MDISQEQISKVLSEISGRVPKLLLKRAFHEEKLTPTVEFVLQESLKSETISDEKKKQIKTVLDSGDVSKMKIVEDHVVTKKIDQFWAREINKAIKQGRLPPRSKIMQLPDFKHFYDAQQKVHSSEDKGTHRDQRADESAVVDSDSGPRAGI